jgi:hypothetical protein
MRVSSVCDSGSTVGRGDPPTHSQFGRPVGGAAEGKLFGDALF